ncbi:glycerol-3-phosphate dehydrogenase/oxidase [Aquibacillus salsiterrae]|uniref:Glycerol-3-phosphate dehydrogenase n=1 Tax=Aquibacillus salsiterrae TaxID=2950439 RepID=A0A9X3WFS8_9BACI|nr:glycerol-3-phosphate dehydrogenase/oxidase [Aquibacillus salsiterrae]MDC3416639.1 glycerol-3-phosphate dehydrogenase/oxidase [Aquibacillus salsiterrae]
MLFSSLNRSQTYDKMENEELDLLVIGGGITGAGIALDAVTRGMKVAVIEKQDFAAGTSSRSTKLVHGGLRYLKQFEVKMVAEVGRERAVVYENGPHVTTPEWMMLPFYNGGTFGPLSTNLGLRVYDFLAGVKKSERRKMFNKSEALEREPLLNDKNLKGAGCYVEYKTDDARLTIEVMKKAVEKGALALNYASADKFHYKNGKLMGVEVKDQINGENRIISARYYVNATGPWVDTLREMDNSKQGKTLRLTKGIHLVFDQSSFPLKQAIYFDTPDGRMIFAIPRDGKTYVGTTDTVYEGDIAHPTMTMDDRDYLLKAIDSMFPQVNIRSKDIESSWAGLRPLIYEEGKDPSEISRKDEIFESESGLISIAGGKLTGYRKMAESVVDLVAKKVEKNEAKLFAKSSTKHLPISGGDVGGSKGFELFKSKTITQGKQLGFTEKEATEIVHRYGSNAMIIFEIYQEEKKQPKHLDLDPFVYALLRYAIDYELCYKPVDFFIRRTDALFFNINWVKQHQKVVIDYMSTVFNWSGYQINEYTNELNRMLYEAVNPEQGQTGETKEDQVL